MTPAGSRREAVSAAIGRADLDGLVRLVDVLARATDWDGLVWLRDLARAALDRGLQLWPAAEYAEYRLALEAPGEIAGPLVVEGAGRFAPGPLWEVAASSHQWAELRAHLPPGPARALAAHERVVRGEDLADDPLIDAAVVDIPAVLQDWEPAYPVATFHADRGDFPSPAPPDLHLRALPPGGRRVDDEESLEALLALARPWADQSNGRVEAVLVEGGAGEAIAALGHAQVSAEEIGGASALAWMAWAAASGGAYGRRRGTAAGRLAAWWTVAVLADREWPVPAGELGEALHALRWVAWQPPEFTAGWGLHLAGEVPAEGLGFAVAAADSRREAEEESETRRG